MIIDVLGRGVMRRVTAYFADAGSLIDSNVVDEEFRGEGEMGKIDILPVVGHPEVHDLLVRARAFKHPTTKRHDGEAEETRKVPLRGWVQE